MAIFQHKSVDLTIFLRTLHKNSIDNLRCLLKNLRSLQKIYATAGCTGCDKYHVCPVWVAERLIGEAASTNQSISCLKQPSSLFIGID